MNSGIVFYYSSIISPGVFVNKQSGIHDNSTQFFFCYDCLQLAIEYPRIQELMSTNPQIHHGHALPSFLDRRVPFPVDHQLNHVLYTLPCQHFLGLERPKHAGSDRCGDERLDVTQHEDVGRLAEAQSNDGADGTEERRQVRRYHRNISLALSQQRREIPQELYLRHLGHRGSERSLPDAEQRTALGDACPTAHGADDRRVKLVIQVEEGLWIAVGSENEWQGCGGEGGDGRGQEI